MNHKSIVVVAITERATEANTTTREHLQGGVGSFVFFFFLEGDSANKGGAAVISSSILSCELTGTVLTFSMTVFPTLFSFSFTAEGTPSDAGVVDKCCSTTVPHECDEINGSMTQAFGVVSFPFFGVAFIS